MKKFSKLLTLALAVLFVTAIFAGCQKKENVLIVGTNAEFPPFEYVNDDGEIDGFDMALMKAVAENLGMEIKIENMEFKGLIGAISSGKINVIAAGMTINDERKESCDFTAPYIKSTQIVLVKKDNTTIKAAADLEGKKIAVQEGTTGDFIATDDVKNSSVQRFKKYVDALNELKNGKVDAVIIDSKPGETALKSNDTLMQVTGLVMADEEYGFAVKKGNTELLDKINKAIDNLKADGTYDKLVKEYIG